MISKRPRWIYLVEALIVVALLAACGSSAKSSSSSTTAAAPTTASAPTTAAAPTSPPTTAAPTPTTNSFDKSYGAFAPTSQSGSGDGVVPIPADAKAGLVAATYSGSSNFVIEGLNTENESSGDLLVNEIGTYTGTTAFGFGISGKPPVKLKVTASGPWTIKLSPISTAPTLASPASGKGDAVYLWTGKATTWAITHQGSSNFVVTNNGSGLLGHSLLVNEIGAYTGSVPVKAGPAITTIESDGAWTITFS